MNREVRPYECCREAENCKLYRDPEKPDQAVEQCQVCKCRHHVIFAKEAIANLLGGSINSQK